MRNLGLTAQANALQLTVHKDLRMDTQSPQWNSR